MIAFTIFIGSDGQFPLRIRISETIMVTISLRLRRKAAGDVSWLPIDINFLKQLWLPNVYVYDLVSFNPLECLEKLAGLWVVQKKEIFYNLVRAAIA